jgi:hypothetical protein
MKPKTKARRAAHKRDLFAELSEGMTALAEARHGKRTLRTHAVEFKQTGSYAQGPGGLVRRLPARISRRA